MIYLYNSDFINLSALLSHILKGARFYKKPKGNYRPYKDGPNFIVNSLTDCPIKTVGVYTTYEKRTEQRGEKCVSKMEEDPYDLLGQGSSTLNSHQQTLSPTEEITAVGLHKSLHPVFEGARAVEKVASEKMNQVKAKAKVKTISKQMEQVHRQNETDILLSRAIHLEQELGREPTILDFLCHFNHIEIDLIWDSLLFLYPSLGRKEWSSTTCPDVKQMRVLA